MSSPSPKKHSGSPIRNLQRSPRRSRHLHTIHEEEVYEQKKNLSLSYENQQLSIQNRVLNDTLRSYADQSHHFALENSRLKKQNQSLKLENYEINVVQVERLKKEIVLKDSEIQKLKSDVQLLRSHFEKDLEVTISENQSLHKQIMTLQKQSYIQTEKLKEKYNNIALDDLNLARRTYMDDLKKVMDALQSTKSLLSQKQLQLKQLTIITQASSNDYSINLENLITENNILRNTIMQIELKKDNEVKQAQTKKQLQKSRTHGILSYCKENTAFMEKQISHLAESLLEKSISIDQFTKDILKMRRNLENTQRRYEEKLQKKDQECVAKILDMQDSIRKMEKFYKQEIADMRKKQMELVEIIARKDHENDTVNRELDHTKHQLDHKAKELEESKANLVKLHEEHAKDISKVMTESKVKRRSMKNLSEVSSLRDLSVQGGSTVIKRTLQRQNSLVDNNSGSSGALYTVPQEIVHSQLVQNGQEDDIDLKELVIHYQSIMEELKQNQSMEMNLVNEKVDKLNRTLREKQQEVLQILERFSPLMEYKLNSVSIEEERRQKIEKHYKADIDILGVLLDKYNIVSLSAKKH